MYTLVHSTADGQAIDVAHPRGDRAHPLRVKLSEGRVIILPPLWTCQLRPATGATEFKGSVAHIYEFTSVVATLAGLLD